MLVYELYSSFQRTSRGPRRRESERACIVLMVVCILLYLHSGEAAPFQRAIARLAAVVLHQPAYGAQFLRTP